MLRVSTRVGPAIRLYVILACAGAASACATAGVGGDQGTGDVDASEPAKDAGRDASVRGGDANVGTPDSAGGQPDADVAVDAGAAMDGGGMDADGVESGASDSAMEAGETDAGVDAGPVADGGCAQHGYTGTLVTFDLSAQPGNEASAAATSTASGVSGGAIARAAALTAVGGTGSINASGWPAATSSDNLHYYTFTVTPAGACVLTLSSLALDVKASAADGPKMVAVGTSADGFTARATLSGTATANVPLAGATGQGTLEVRIYGYSAPAAGGTLRVQNTLTVSGSLN